MACVVPWARVVVVGPGDSRRAVMLVGEGAPDLAVVDRLARLQLAARRAGGRIRLEDPCPGLLELLNYLGLRRQVGGQAEGGEEALGVEEGVDPRDPIP